MHLEHHKHCAVQTVLCHILLPSDGVLVSVYLAVNTVRFELCALSLAFCGHFFLLLLVWIWPMNAWFRRQPKACAEFMHRPSLFEDSPSLFSIWHLTRPLSVIFSLQKTNGFSIRVWGILVQPQLCLWVMTVTGSKLWKLRNSFMLIICSTFRLLFKTYLYLLSVQNLHVVVRPFVFFQFAFFFF